VELGVTSVQPHHYHAFDVICVAQYFEEDE
jgi:hypothetical protein